MDYFTNFVKASVGDFAHMSGCLLTGVWTAKSLPTTTDRQSWARLLP